MAFGGNARTAGRAYRDLHLRQKRLYHKRVRYNANIGAKSDKSYLTYFLSKMLFIKELGELSRAEGRLVYYSPLFYICKLTSYFPAKRAADAVLDREIFSFLCLEIVSFVSVSRKDDFSVKILYLFDNYLMLLIIFPLYKIRIS